MSNLVVSLDKRRETRYAFLVFLLIAGLCTLGWFSFSSQSKPVDTLGYRFPRRENYEAGFGPNPLAFGIGATSNGLRPNNGWQFKDDADFSTQAKLWTEAKHLILVPGHAVHTCTDAESLKSEAPCWYLLPYQRNQTPIFLDHIKKGAELASHDSGSLLMFSGGQTRGAVGPLSEAAAYYHALMLLEPDSAAKPRTVLEEYARDSFENVAFSLCRFKQLTGRFPERMTVVGFPFKEARFRQLHWPAIARGIEGGDQIRFDYVSIGNEKMLQGALVDDAYPDFEKDPLGDKPPLSSKRRSRDPFKRPHPYAQCLPSVIRP